MKELDGGGAGSQRQQLAGGGSEKDEVKEKETRSLLSPNGSE